VLTGCTVENSGSTLSITARTEEPVLLPCSCTDLHSTPESFIWKYYTQTPQYIKTQEVISVQHTNRVLLFNEHYPGNLSLLIPHLTEEDAGWYRCDAKISGYIDVILTVKGKPNLDNNGTKLEITAHAGESVLLPCSCTDLNSTPNKLTWRKHNTTRNRWEEISSESDQYRNRVQLFNNLSPANLSLLISHLTEEDAGDYSCEVKGSEYTHITVMVKHGKNIVWSRAVPRLQHEFTM
ncbi:cell surface A33 antigen-like isoform X1, partial [Astyanax mexicanus]